MITLLSPKVAEAGQCAHEQGKFWEFHDLVYELDGAIAADNVKGYAAEIGLDWKSLPVNAPGIRTKIANQ